MTDSQICVVWDFGMRSPRLFRQCSVSLCKEVYLRAAVGEMGTGNTE